MENPEKRSIIAVVKEFVSTASHSRTLSLLFLLLIIAAVPLTVFVAQQQQEIRQQAQEVRTAGGEDKCKCSSFSRDIGKRWTDVSENGCASVGLKAFDNSRKDEPQPGTECIAYATWTICGGDYSTGGVAGVGSVACGNSCKESDGKGELKDKDSGTVCQIEGKKWGILGTCQKDSEEIKCTPPPNYCDCLYSSETKQYEWTGDQGDCLRLVGKDITKNDKKKCDERIRSGSSATKNGLGNCRYDGNVLSSIEGLQFSCARVWGTFEPGQIQPPPLSECTEPKDCGDPPAACSDYDCESNKCELKKQTSGSCTVNGNTGTCQDGRCRIKSSEPCALESAYWEKGGPVEEGEWVGLIAEGSGDCKDEEVKFRIERDGLFEVPAEKQPQPATFDRTTAWAFWRAEYNSLIPWTNTEWYFEASINNDLPKNSGKLEVEAGNGESPQTEPPVRPLPSGDGAGSGCDGNHLDRGAPGDRKPSQMCNPDGTDGGQNDPHPDSQYDWVVHAEKDCTSNDECTFSSLPDGNWCYGFQRGAVKKCMELKRKSSDDTPGDQGTPPPAGGQRPSPPPVSPPRGGANTGLCTTYPAISPPADKYKWKGNCNTSESCFVPGAPNSNRALFNSKCEKYKNDFDPFNVNPADSYWCYGFTADTANWRCLTLVREGCEKRGDPGCEPIPVTPTKSISATPTVTSAQPVPGKKLADLNKDGKVDILDREVLRIKWINNRDLSGCPGHKPSSTDCADINKDTIFDIYDVQEWYKEAFHGI